MIRYAGSSVVWSGEAGSQAGPIALLIHAYLEYTRLMNKTLHSSSTAPLLFMLAGIPTSGKSTYIRGLLRDFPDAVVISTDDYIEAAAKETGKTYNEVFDDNIKAANTNLNDKVASAIKAGKTIIWDQTNLTCNVRRKKLSRFPKSYIKALVYFNIDLDTALERNTNRLGKVIPPALLRDMHDNYELPTDADRTNFNYVIRGGNWNWA